MFNYFNISIFFVITLQLKSEVLARKKPINDENGGFDFSEEELRKFHIWPLGDIPYYIDDFSFDKVLRDQIRFELDLITKATGLHFTEIPRPPEDDASRWVFFLNRKGQQECADIAFKNFTSEGVQKVILGYDCFENRNLAAIVLAIVGVPPQHNAPNRNMYIKIHQNNILPDKKYLFNILKDNEWLFHDLPYDVESAGHYQLHQYTSNGAATITLLNKEFPHKFELSSLHKLSILDIKKIKLLYNYISRKRLMPKYVEGCKKLFQPGSNIKNFQVPKDNVKPLKKPNKYLGINTPSDLHDDDKNDNKKDESKSKDKNIINKKNSTETVIDKKPHENVKNDTSIKNNTINEKESTKPQKKGNVTTLMKHIKANQRLVSSILKHSDYNSE